MADMKYIGVHFVFAVAGAGKGDGLRTQRFADARTGSVKSASVPLSYRPGADYGCEKASHCELI